MLFIEQYCSEVCKHNIRKHRKTQNVTNVKGLRHNVWTSLLYIMYGHFFCRSLSFGCSLFAVSSRWCHQEVVRLSFVREPRPRSFCWYTTWHHVVFRAKHCRSNFLFLNINKSNHYWPLRRSHASQINPVVWLVYYNFHGCLSNSGYSVSQSEWHLFS